eukprot:2352369-Rhodomonas_salina.1
MSNVSFEDHWAVDGGAIYVNFWTTLEMSDNVRVSNNEAWNQGGGVHVWARCSVSLTNGVHIEDNLGFEGGGLYIGGAVTLTMANNVNVRRNIGNTRGAGMVVAFETTAYLYDGVSFVGNAGSNSWSGLTFGGALHVEAWSNVVARGSVHMTHNSAMYG